MPTQPDGQDDPQDRISLRKDVRPDDRDVIRAGTTEVSRIDPGDLPEAVPSTPSLAARATRAVTTTRDRAAGQLTTVVVPVIRLAAHALRIVAAAPVLAGLLLLWAAISRGGPVVRESLLLVLLGCIPAAWLAVRRHQLLRAVRAPAELTADLIAVVSGRELWEGLAGNLRSGPKPVSSGRALWALRGLWRGVKAGGGVLDSLTGRPTLVPLMPGRLRGLLMLCVACLVTAGILLAYAVINALLAGIG
ncbi:hypothetical protein JL107_01965 [Nakamurella flavida]|uniref:Uncharacterized protein n=1 Tax=Nakamurella flavida TaxID=363630 RepID=A0A939C4G5_9ACTN|nr:hypothetical protein [Nakamurella flavida]MBM9475202.1 hypothetical protein [Nakamurella flavida]MDP9776775.1 hypothetical protein [Nakamurella flavida]